MILIFGILGGVAGVCVAGSAETGLWSSLGLVTGFTILGSLMGAWVDGSEDEDDDFGGRGALAL